MTGTDEAHFRGIDPDGNLNLSVDPCRYFTLDQFNSSFSADGNNYMLLNQNIQSFHAKKAIFEAFLDSLSAPLNTIVLTETCNDSHNLQLCKIDNFEPVHTHRSVRQSQHGRIGGGVSIFANTTIYDIKKIDELSLCNDSIETCVARIHRLNNVEYEHFIVGV